MPAEFTDVDLFGDATAPKKQTERPSRARKTKQPKRSTSTTDGKHEVVAFSFDAQLSSLYENIKIRKGPIKASSEPGSARVIPHGTRRNSTSNSAGKNRAALLRWNMPSTSTLSTKVKASADVDYNHIPDMQLEHYAECFRHASEQQQHPGASRWSNPCSMQHHLAFRHLYTTFARTWLEQWFESSLSTFDILKIVNLVIDGVYAPPHRYEGKISCADFCIIMHLCSLCQMPNKSYFLPRKLPRELHPCNAIFQRLKQIGDRLKKTGRNGTDRTHENDSDSVYDIARDRARVTKPRTAAHNGKSVLDDDESKQAVDPSSLQPAAGGSDDEMYDEGDDTPPVAKSKRKARATVSTQPSKSLKRNGSVSLFDDDDDDVVAKAKRNKLVKTADDDEDAVIKSDTRKNGGLLPSAGKISYSSSAGEKSSTTKGIPLPGKLKSSAKSRKPSPENKTKRPGKVSAKSSQSVSSSKMKSEDDDEDAETDGDDDKKRQEILKKITGGVNTVKKRRNIKQVKQFSTTQRALLEQEQARLNTLKNDDDEAVRMLADVDAELRAENAPLAAEANVLSPIDELINEFSTENAADPPEIVVNDPDVLPSSMEQLVSPKPDKAGNDDAAAKFKAMLDALPDDDADDAAVNGPSYYAVDHFDDLASPYRGGSPLRSSGRLDDQHEFSFNMPKPAAVESSFVLSPSAANTRNAEHDDTMLKHLKNDDFGSAKSSQQALDVPMPSTVAAEIVDKKHGKTAAVSVVSPAASNSSDEIEIVDVKVNNNPKTKHSGVHLLGEKSRPKTNSTAHRGESSVLPRDRPQHNKRPAAVFDGAAQRNVHDEFSYAPPSASAVPLGQPRQQHSKNAGNFAYISGLSRDRPPNPAAAANVKNEQHHSAEQSSQSSSDVAQNECEIVGTSNANVVHDARLMGIHTDDSKNRAVDGKILINVNHPRRDPSLYCAEHLTQSLKPHQIGGLRFIYDNLIQNQTSYLEQHGYGAVLAHVMGLGKTLQVIAFLELLFRHFAPLKDAEKKQQHVLLIVPVNCLHHWLEEFERWMPRTKRPKNMPVYYVEKSSMRDRIASVGSWHASGGVLLIGYEMFRSLAICTQKISKNQKILTADEFFNVKQESNNQTNALNSLLDGAHDEILNGTTALKAEEAKKLKQAKKNKPKNKKGDAKAKKTEKGVLSRKIKSDFDDDAEIDDAESDDAGGGIDSDSRDSADRDASSSEDSPPPSRKKSPKRSPPKKRRARIEEDSEDDDDAEDNEKGEDDKKPAGVNKKAATHERAISHIMMHKADIIICDEGHRIKNHKSQISETLKHIRTKRRLILTGTPMQNNLSEYWCMVDFVRPGLLGSKKEFDGMFRMPIENGQCVDSTEWDVVLMLKRTYVLQKILMGVVQRRGYEVVKQQLPSKHETVIVVKQSKDQYQLARDVVRVTIEHLMQAQERINPLLMYAVFKKVFTHPCMFLRAVERLRSEMTLEAFKEEFGDFQALEGNQRAMRFAHIAFNKVFDPYIEQLMKPNIGKSFIPSNMSPKLTVLRTILEHVAGRMDEKILVFTQSTQTLDWIEQCLTHEWKYFHVDVSPPTTNSDTPDAKARPRRMRQVDMYSMLKAHGKLSDSKKSNKTFTDGEEVVIEDSSDDDVVVESDAGAYGISQRTSQLKLGDDDADSKPPATANRRSVRIPWEPNRTYLRFDGQTSVRERTERIHKFNHSDDIVLFLISTEAGGIGVNLSAASRVILFDVCWNPSHDEQAIARVYRFGQTRSCHIYRLVTGHCMEERVFKRQIKKQTVSHRVVDQKNMQRCLTNAEVQALISVDDYHASCGDQNDTADEDDEIVIDTSRSRGGNGREADEFDKQRVARAEDDAVMKVVYDTCAHLLSRQPFYVDSLLQIDPGSSLSDEDKKTAFDEYKRDTDPSIQPAARFYNFIANGGDPAAAAAAAAAIQNGVGGAGGLPRFLANNNGIPLPASAVYFGGMQSAAGVRGGGRGNYANRLPPTQSENDDIQIQYAQQKNAGAGTATGNANASGQRQYNFQTLLRQLLSKDIVAWLEPGDASNGGAERLMLVNGEMLMECEQGSGKLLPVRPMPRTSSEFKRIKDHVDRQRRNLPQ